MGVRFVEFLVLGQSPNKEALPSRRHPLLPFLPSLSSIPLLSFPS